MAAERSVTIFGAGAVGGYLGAKLSLATPPARITVIGRSRVTAGIRAHGLIVHEPVGSETARPELAASAAAAPSDLVLLTVRTYDVESAIEDLPVLLGDTGILVAFQNGVGTEEMLAARLGRSRVVAGTLTASVSMDNPGVITRYGRDGGVALATLDGTPIPRWIRAAFEATGLPTVILNDYRSLRWSKLLLNMLGAATTAILDVDIGEVMRDPKLFRLEQLAFREAGRVIDAQGIPTVKLPGYPVPLARSVMRTPRVVAQGLLGKKVAAARSGRSPTMRSDMHRGRTEVAAFNGAVVQAGKALGIAAPVNTVLTDLTLELAEHPDMRDAYRGNSEALIRRIREARTRLRRQ